MVDSNISKTVLVNWRFVLKIAASLVFVLTVGYLFKRFYQPFQDTSQAKLVHKVNPKGQKTRISLADGSYVWLNADSRLTYPVQFSKDERFLRLDGEAFFEVAKDSLKPFRVMAGDLLVEARGTSFNIKVSKNNKKANVALNSGKVLVTLVGSDQSPILLEPGQQAYANPGGNYLLIKPFNYQEKISWKDGIIYFKDAGLEEVTRRLSDWYGVEFEIDGSPKDEWHYSGEFNNDILDNVMKSMSFAEKFTYRINGDHIYLKF